MRTLNATAPPAAVHLDLDGATHVYRAHGWRYEAPTDPLFVSGLGAFLEWFDSLGIRATLFVIAEDLRDPAKRELLLEASRQGHEIASHSLTHRLLTSLSDQEKDRELKESRELLGEVLGGRVVGFRAPGFEVDSKCLELIDEAGYEYDSSLFPGRARRGRITAEGTSPYRALPNRQLVEIPMPDHKPLPLPFHPSYSLVIGLWYFRLGLKRFRQTGASLSLLFHLTDLADPLPAGSLQSWRQSLFTLSHIGLLREKSGGKPVGFKICIGNPQEFFAICKAMRETGITPDFITVDGGEGGTGAAPQEYSDHLGMPLREGLFIVQNALVGMDLRDRMKLAASGKRSASHVIAGALALGANWCNIARGFMFSVGCIQSQSCHTNRCPVGVATQDSRLQRGLVVRDKAVRAENFHRNTVHALAEMTAACGLDHPNDFEPHHLYERVEPHVVRRFDQIYSLFEPGQLLDGNAGPTLQPFWDAANAKTFESSG